MLPSSFSAALEFKGSKMKEMEARNKTFQFLEAILVFSLMQTQALAIKKSFIVYLGGHSHGLDATLEDYERATSSHYELLSSFLGSKEKAQNAIFHSYTKSINAFAAVLEDEEALQLSKDPNVISIFENKPVQLHTTHSWDLVNLVVNDKIPSSSLWAKARFGEDTIIANLDSGVWPESKSFSDEGMGPIPSRWKGYCQNDTKLGVPCNRKLIGARYFNITSPSDPKASMQVPLSARDEVGHGSHTLATAGGSFVPGANLFGQANGTAKGGSPRARVAAYKVCWPEGDLIVCNSANILAGFDAAIHDGVDVISVSLGGEINGILENTVTLGAFHAVMNGITVVCSAGNYGPFNMTILNDAPWVITVGAGTIDRSFPTFLTLGNNKQIVGQSLSADVLPKNKFYPLINAQDAKAANTSADIAKYCFMDSLDPKKVKGKIVVCVRGELYKTEKSEAVRKAGGVGLIVVNDDTDGDITGADPYFISGINIAYSDSSALYSYINSTKSPVATISAPTTAFGVKPTPVVSKFSSRGPSIFLPEVIKPDILAPGEAILAAFTGAVSPTGTPYDTRRVKYNLMSGTSMSCPHVSGVAGLLKTLYPDWSPSRIKSAIMTTARTRDNMGSPISDPYTEKTSPFDYGSGYIRPNRAMDPGLVYDLTNEDYLNFLCADGYTSSQLSAILSKPFKCPANPMKMTDLNYPSIAYPYLNDTTFVTRTVTNVGSPGVYRARVKAPAGISVSVKPSVLEFTKVGEKKEFQVHLKPEKGSFGAGYQYGMMVWSDGKHYVRSPLALNAVAPN